MRSFARCCLTREGEPLQSEFPVAERFSVRSCLSGLIATPGSKGILPLAQRPASEGGAAPDTVTPASFSEGPAQGWPSGSVARALGEL